MGFNSLTEEWEAHAEAPERPAPTTQETEAGEAESETTEAATDETLLHGLVGDEDLAEQLHGLVVAYLDLVGDLAAAEELDEAAVTLDVTDAQAVYVGDFLLGAEQEELDRLLDDRRAVRVGGVLELTRVQTVAHGLGLEGLVGLLAANAPDINMGVGQFDGGLRVAETLDDGTVDATARQHLSGRAEEALRAVCDGRHLVPVEVIGVDGGGGSGHGHAEKHQAQRLEHLDDE